MKEDNLDKRVFACLVLVVILIAASGCTVTRYDWFPDNDSSDPKKKRPGLINVLKISPK